MIFSITFLLLVAVVKGRTVNSKKCNTLCYKPVGCYKDDLTSRDQSKQLFNDRSNIDWKNWDSYYQRLICRCAGKAKNEGYEAFSIQYYGECWAGSKANFTKIGTSESCIGKQYKPCNSPKKCVGQAETNFVYQLGNFYQDAFNCKCLSGFMIGSSCETSERKDPCSPNPCANGGQCEDKGDGFKCTCTVGFKGSTCKQKDYCFPHPCNNGGQCTNEKDGFSCLCAIGFIGKNCSRRDPCSPNPCANGGQCRDKGDGFKCTCTVGFKGSTCKQKDFCSPNPCKNNGTCTNKGNSSECDCAIGFKNLTCDQIICPLKMDVGIVLDSSGSVGEKNFKKIVTFLMELVSYLHVSPDGSHIAMLHYDHRTYKDFDFSNRELWDLQKCRQRIAQVKYTRGGTLTQEALKRAAEFYDLKNGCRKNDKSVEKVLIVITDGETFGTPDELDGPSDALKEAGVSITAVGIGDKAPEKELLKMASLTPDNVMEVSSFDVLISKMKEKLQELLKKTCTPEAN